MAKLIQNINGSISDIISDNITSIQDVKTSVKTTTCNHIEVPGFEAFVFDFSKATSSEVLISNNNYGLIVNNNSIFKDLNISY